MQQWWDTEEDEVPNNGNWASAHLLQSLCCHYTHCILTHTSTCLQCLAQHEHMSVVTSFIIPYHLCALWLDFCTGRTCRAYGYCLGPGLVSRSPTDTTYGESFLSASPLVLIHPFRWHACNPDHQQGQMGMMRMLLGSQCCHIDRLSTTTTTT